MDGDEFNSCGGMDGKGKELDSNGQIRPSGYCSRQSARKRARTSHGPSTDWRNSRSGAMGAAGGPNPLGVHAIGRPAAE